MKLIGLSGYPGSGKDTAASALLARGWKRLAFGDRLKEGAFRCDPIVGIEIPPWYSRNQPRTIRLSWAVAKYGMEGAKRKFPEARRFFQRYGTEGGRDIHGQDCWLKVVREAFDSFESMPPEEQPAGAVITDVRMRNEYDFVKERGGMVYFIERESLDYVPDHGSEAYQFPFDGRIQNNWPVNRLHNDLLELVGENVHVLNP